ncbi:MAG: sortase [Patescibacteria group bacterium]
MQKKNYIIFVNIFLIFIGLSTLVYVYAPLLIIEAKYNLLSNKVADKNTDSSNTKINKDFWLEIPSISISAPVVANIDVYNDLEYQESLTRGVAHAKQSSTPNISGNTFIFGHSAENWFNANKYNAIFYLLYKLKNEDVVYLWYKNIKYEYLVKTIKFVSPSETNYITYPQNESKSRTLTLMTCWPPGTTIKRLVVISELRRVSK